MGKCYWTQQEDPSVRAQIDANTQEISEYTTLKSAISNLTNGMQDCLSGLECCYSSATQAIAGTDFTGIFDSNILSYKDTYSSEISELETMSTNINNKIASLEAENAKLNKVLYKTVQVCD